MDRVTELERQVAQLQWRLKGVDRERRMEGFRLRGKLAEMEERLRVHHELLADLQARISAHEGH
jgi:hypothetical protein